MCGGWPKIQQKTKTIQRAGGESLPSKCMCGRMRLGRCLSLHANELKWIESLNLTRRNLKNLREENRGSVLALVLVMIFFFAFDPRGKAAAGKIGGAALAAPRGNLAGEKGSRHAPPDQAPDPDTRELRRTGDPKTELPEASTQEADKAHEKVLRITHQETRRNHTEIAPHSCQEWYQKEDEVSSSAGLSERRLWGWECQLA